MKYLLLLSVTVILFGCSANETTQSPEKNNSDIQAVVPDIPEDSPQLNLGLGVVLDDFTQRQLITSPLTLTGVAPRYFYFEGSFPVTLMTLEEDIVKAWYATGPWLDPLPGRDVTDLGAEDPIPFTTTIEFEAPDQAIDMGKIRFAKDLVMDEAVPEYVETMILWP